MRWTMVMVGAVVVGVGAVNPAEAQKPVEQQIREAVMALPEADRAGATVLGYTHGDDLPTVIRQGTNQYVCLADDPSDDDRGIYQIACYHESLEPFMARGRQLRAEGLNEGTRRERRRQEVEDGTLPMPDHAALLQMRGTINPSTGYPDSVSVLRVLYMPYATAATTGFPETMSRGAPWLMDPGQHRAHVMIPGEVVPFRPGHP